MENLRFDLHYTFRLISKNIWFTVLVVLILAVGIGANAAVFSAVNSVLLRPLLYADPDRLIAVAANLSKMGIYLASSSSAEYLHLRENSKSFSEIGAYSSPISYNLSGVEEPERIESMYVTENFFSVLGVRPQLGRTFEPQDQNPGLTTLAVISHGLWTRRFGADPQTVGKVIRLDSDAFTIIGVMPPSFRHPTPLASLNVEVWIAAGFVAPPFEPPGRGSRMIRLIGRLKPQGDLEQARAEMKLLGSQLQAQYPDRYPPDSGFSLDLRPLQQRIVGDFRPVFLILMITVSFVLLIACTNVANLLLARANVRQREMAIRTALGASRGRLIRQLLTESIVLSLLGGAVGLLVTYWFSSFLTRMGQMYVPGITETRIDWRVLLFTLIVSCVTAILFGLAPSLQISKPQVNEMLKEGPRGSTGGVRRGKASALLVVTEFALALVLLIGAGLLVKSFWNLQKVDLGFNPDNLLTMQIALAIPNNLQGARYGTAEQRANFYKQLLERLRATPGVKSAGIVTALPMSAPPLLSQKNYPVITIRGREVRNPSDVAKTEWHLVSPEYFRTMGIPLLRGQGITELDGANASFRVVINEALAQRYFSNEEPIGKFLKLGPESSDAPWFEVIGVLSNFRNEGLDTKTVPEMYVPYYQLPEPSMSLVVRTAGDPASMAPAVIGAVRSIDRDQPVFQVRTMQDIMASSVGIRSFSTTLLGIFAIVALFLAGIGIYGVMSYSVTQRVHEIGIRMALGAQQSDILKLILLRGLLLAVIGCSIGVMVALLAGLAVTRLISGFLYGVTTLDPITFVLAAAILIGIGLIASCIPAFRATKVNPVVALRNE